MMNTVWQSGPSHLWWTQSDSQALATYDEYSDSQALATYDEYSDSQALATYDGKS